MMHTIHHRAAVSAGVWLVILLSARTAVVADELITPGAQLTAVYTQPFFYEGPTWDPASGSLYFTQLTGSSTIHRLTPPNTVATWMPNTQAINGTFLGADGRLLCAQGDARRILSLRIGANGPEDQVVLASNPLWKAPNDLCQSPSGDIFFTTPDFDNRTASVVYHLSPTGAVKPIITEMTLPNGIITSLDGTTLYVSDSQQKWWRSYPILPDGSVGGGSLFFQPTTSDTRDPDGMSIDELGNLYFSGRGGVWIVSPAGVALQLISVPVFVTNVTFGGIDGRTLYLTCDQRVYSLSMQVRGGSWRDIVDPNAAPQVSAGTDRIIALPHRTVSLFGTVSDDGLPDPPGAVTATWTRIAGPGVVTFADASSPATSATFSLAGAYTLRLSAFDGIRWATDDVAITVAKTADFDADGDVDAIDVGRLDACRTGAGGGPLSEDCALVDLDEDGDVDQSDFGMVQQCMSGPFMQSDPNCAE